MPSPVIYFARHGETDWNAEKRLQGQKDIPLNALGRIQGARCGEILRDLFARQGISANTLDYVSSPLGRARDTMELIRSGLALDPSRYRMDDRLKEMSFGRWEGFTYPELQGREAEALAARDANKWGYVLPDGESYARLQERVRGWYETVDRDTVVASHGGVCRVLMAHLGILPNDTASTGNVAQGVIYVFTGSDMDIVQ